jgi:hypothetical protein
MSSSRAKPNPLSVPKPAKTVRQQPPRLNAAKPPKRAARPVAGASRVDLVLGAADARWLDEFAATHRPPISSRAEAVRRLIALMRARG